MASRPGSLPATVAVPLSAIRLCLAWAQLRSGDVSGQITSSRRAPRIAPADAGVDLHRNNRFDSMGHADTIQASYDRRADRGIHGPENISHDWSSGARRGGPRP